MKCIGPRVAAATYNLYWWCISNKFWNCPQFAFGKGFGQLFHRISTNPVDLIGFQECEDVGQVIESSGLLNYGYYPTPQGNDAPMAWNLAKFKAIEGPASEWIAKDSYSSRLNWVRLLEYESNSVVFFANTHGPLGQCAGKAGHQVAESYLSSIWKHIQPQDKVIFTGDFNCKMWDQTLVSLRRSLQDTTWDTVFGGADHIFSGHGVGLCSHESVVGAPSDHQLLKAVLLPLGGPKPPEVPKMPEVQNKSGLTSANATVKKASHGCPKTPSNGPCCRKCPSNRFCPGDGGCYAEGQPGCVTGTCDPTPAELLL